MSYNLFLFIDCNGHSMTKLGCYKNKNRAEEVGTEVVEKLRKLNYNSHCIVVEDEVETVSPMQVLSTFYNTGGG